MGFSKKPQVDGCLELQGNRWVIAGISIHTSLKPINTAKPIPQEGEGEEDASCSTTPKLAESRIPNKLSCPPAPRKRRPLSKCRINDIREFFTPPDLESVFKLRTERTN